MDERDQVHRVACESGAVIDWEHHGWCHNEVTRRLCDGERNYVQKEMNDNQSNSAIWKVIRNCILSKEKLRPVFNKFFTSVGDESKRLASVNAPSAYKPPPLTLCQDHIPTRGIPILRSHYL